MFCKGGDLRIFRTSRDSGLIAPASGYVRRYWCVGCARISRLLSRQAQAEQLEAILITPAARPPGAWSSPVAYLRPSGSLRRVSSQCVRLHDPFGWPFGCNTSKLYRIGDR